MSVCVQFVLERYNRNIEKAVSDDVSSRRFNVAHRQLELTYHLGDGRFIPAQTCFYKPRKPTTKLRRKDFSTDMYSIFQVQHSSFKLFL